jgi:hypothetical protein
MQGDKHLGAELLAVIDALCGTLDPAQRQLEHARQIQSVIIVMAGLTLRHTAWATSSSSNSSGSATTP